MKKIVSIIILLSMIVTLVACGGNDKDTSNDAYVTDASGEATAFSTVRKADYDGYAVKILYMNAAGMDRDFKAEELNGSVWNDKVYERNLLVSDTYNVTLSIEQMVTAEVTTLIRNTALSGDSPYDIYGLQRPNLTLSYEGLLYDMSTVKDIDLTQEWWDQNWVDTMSVNGHLYSLVGDISPSTLQYASSLAFNKVLFANNGLEEPYDLVRQGKWTYEEYFKYVSGVSQDLNEDQTYDEDDYLGVVGWGTEASYTLFYGMDISFARVNKSGNIALGYNNEKLIDIYEKVYRLWITENNYIRLSTGGTNAFDNLQKVISVFKEDRALFLDSVLYMIGDYVSDMESDYGILPMPKYNEDQKEYCSYVGYVIPTTAMAVNVSDPDMIGNIIEACCTSAYDIITPSVYEIITKLQNVRDPDSAEMVDIIIRTKFYDVAHWHTISGYQDFPRVPLTNKTEDITSYLRNYVHKSNSEIKYINDCFNKLAK